MNPDKQWNPTFRLPCDTTTCYYSHLSKSSVSHFLNQRTPLIWSPSYFCGPLMTGLTGFHCIRHKKVPGPCGYEV